MKRIGMTNTGGNFMHPDIEADHPLCEHVFYQINRADWEQAKILPSTLHQSSSKKDKQRSANAMRSARLTITDSVATVGSLN